MQAGRGVSRPACISVVGATPDCAEMGFRRSAVQIRAARPDEHSRDVGFSPASLLVWRTEGRAGCWPYMSHPAEGDSV